jgi:hypothetical protein
MNLRATAVAFANQFEGRCTCEAMDAGVECPWCQVFREILRIQPLGAAAVERAPVRAASLSTP